MPESKFFVSFYFISSNFQHISTSSFLILWSRLATPKLESSPMANVFFAGCFGEEVSAASTHDGPTHTPQALTQKNIYTRGWQNDSYTVTHSLTLGKGRLRFRSYICTFRFIIIPLFFARVINCLLPWIFVLYASHFCH